MSDAAAVSSSSNGALQLSPRKNMTKVEISTLVTTILAEATLAEKVAMMSGHGFFEAYRSDGVWGARPYRAGAGCERLGVPALWFTDGPRGVARGASTCFPCTMARGASFDVDLERRIGEVMAIEARAQGCNLSGAICVNLLRHPAWGRAQETYGEDPHHLGDMGAALGQGLQTHNVIATVKHFALNSMENARFKVDVQIDEATLHDVYLPQFKRILDAGIASVMSAYNKVNGAYCGQNEALLTQILREEWGFEGFVHSDWVRGVYDVSGAVAGLDIENPEPLVWGDKLVAAVGDGRVPAETIDRACRRILTTLYRFMAAEDPLPAYTIDMVAQAEHRALAREAAEKSAVLLKNDEVLPFDRNVVRKVAVLGRLAGLENTGDRGSSRVQAPYVITPLAGLRAYLGDDAVLVADEGDLMAAEAAVDAADAVVVVVGYTAQDEGEFIPGDITLGQEGAVSGEERRRRNPIGGDRDRLGLPSDQVALILAAARRNKPVVVVIVAGSAVLVEDWIEAVGGALQTFYSGMEGGSALASLLFGDISPSGRLPFTVAKSAEDYPYFDRDADEIDYSGPHGYGKFLIEGKTPRFGFGHGLSYAAFSLDNLHVQDIDGVFKVSAELRNTGAVPAETVVMAFAEPLKPDRRWSHKLLKGFARARLAAGESRTIDLTIPYEAFARRDVDQHRMTIRTGAYRLTLETGGQAAPLVAEITLEASVTGQIPDPFLKDSSIL